MTADAVPVDFRGPVMRPLAARILRDHAPSGVLDAAVLGVAARSVVTTPDLWTEWGDQAETLQYVKQLWHCLVRYGTLANDRR
ncbi:hypothetical protein Lfu02_09710 [Longispora fulva]|nr:hypothetical protein Lfu02_09710 [Longispora fulva]